METWKLIAIAPPVMVLLGLWWYLRGVHKTLAELEAKVKAIEEKP
jgi:hypothetical protein